MSKTYKVVIADDHPMILEGLRFMLKHEKSFKIIGEANSYKEVFPLIDKLHPDLIILDQNMNGVNLLNHIPALKASFPFLKFVIISSYFTSQALKLEKEQLLNGVILKKVTQVELIKKLFEAIGKTYSGSSEITLNEKAIQAGHQTRVRIGKSTLSQREIQIMLLITEGLTEKQIAEELFISKHTVHSHRKTLMKKLRLKKAVEIARFVYENHLNA